MSPALRDAIIININPYSAQPLSRWLYCRGSRSCTLNSHGTIDISLERLAD